MCQIFAGQSKENYTCETRSMRLRGFSTSIRLEAAFWSVLDEIAAQEDVTVPQFVSKLHEEVEALHGEVQNFTSLLRCACLIYLRGDQQADGPQADVPQAGGHGIAAE
ncbi:MAG: ribbon-helix-helix domain-containing protein [Pseudomonadota bacterium]